MTDENLKTNFARDMVLLKQVGLHPVIVHGGGPQASHVFQKLVFNGQTRGQPTHPAERRDGAVSMHAKGPRAK